MMEGKEKAFWVSNTTVYKVYATNKEQAIEFCKEYEEDSSVDRGVVVKDQEWEADWQF